MYDIFGVEKELLEKAKKSVFSEPVTDEVYTEFPLDGLTELKASYASAGVSHILCVSGMHVGVIFMILNFLLKPLEYSKPLRLGQRGNRRCP